MVISAGKSRKNIEAYVIIPPESKQAIELLLSTREAVGIPPTNKYLFARLNANTPLSGHSDLRELVYQVDGIEKPERIHSTALRKYIATVSQVTISCCNAYKLFLKKKFQNLFVQDNKV